MSQVHEIMLKGYHYNLIFTKTFGRIFIHSFGAFEGHSEIFKIKINPVFTTAHWSEVYAVVTDSKKI